MIIDVILPGRYVSERAHSLQTAKIVDQFNNYTKCELIVPKRDLGHYSKIDYFNYYNLKNRYSIHQLGNFNLFRFFKEKNSLLLKSLSHILLLYSFLFRLVIFELNRNSVVYVRDFTVAWFLKLFTRKTIIFEVHLLPDECDKFRKFLIRKVDYFIVHTKLIKTELQYSYHIDKCRILISPNGHDLETIKIPKRDFTNKNEIFLGYIGSIKTLNYSKGIEYVIKALSNLNNSFKLLIVGIKSEEDKNYIRKIAKNFRIETDRIKIFDYVSRNQIVKYYEMMDILVLPSPSNSWTEKYNSPLKLFEYLMTGLPIIASKLNPIMEIIDHKNAFLTKPGDPESITQAALAIVDNPDIVDIMYQSNPNLARIYTWENKVKNIFDRLTKLKLVKDN